MNSKDTNGQVTIYPDATNEQLLGAIGKYIGEELDPITLASVANCVIELTNRLEALDLLKATAHPNAKDNEEEN